MKDRKPPVIRDKCGSRAGWNIHQRKDERPCPPCNKANTDYKREWCRRTGRVSKHLTDDQLAALYWYEHRQGRSAERLNRRIIYAEGIERGPEPLEDIVERFATTPHADLEEQ